MAPDQGRLVQPGEAIFCAMGAFGGFMFSTALHLQSGLGESPVRAGCAQAPW